jgi:NAD(P)-dependent dehydrogenase (short-subunit alcohol dehydrogenase family)
MQLRRWYSLPAAWTHSPNRPSDVATADYDSVEYGAQIIDTAVAAFGTVDILINNAGILRDKSFRRMSDADWELIMTVHLKGVFSCTKAAWDIMYEQGFGRIVNVASPAGLYGNVGQANYSTAKMGMVGLTQTLAKEARRAKKDINVNCIAPLAGTRMLESIYPPELVKLLKVEHIVSLVLYLSHGSNAETGSVIECSGGAYQKVQLARATGYIHDLSKGDPSVEDVAENFEKIVDMRDHSLADHVTMMPGSMKGIRNVARYVAWTPSEWIKVLSSAGGWALEQLTGGRDGGGSSRKPKL